MIRQHQSRHSNDEDFGEAVYRKTTTNPQLEKQLIFCSLKVAKEKEFSVTTSVIDKISKCFKSIKSIKYFRKKISSKTPIS
jgi:hypothetical protein